MGWKELFDRFSRFLDPLFGIPSTSLTLLASCLVALGVLKIIFGLTTLNAPTILLISYYLYCIIFNISSLFALILYMTIIGRNVIYKYLGFLNGTFSKGLFYVL